jgi:ATP-dependent DNA ligase
MYTRGNKEYKGLEPLYYILEALCTTYDIDLLDGEMYTNNLQFQALQSTLMRHTGVKPVKYVIFAAVKFGASLTTQAMVTMLKNMKEDLQIMVMTDVIDIVPYVAVRNNPDTIRALCLDYVRQGYEGIMLRHDKLSYDYKRSDALLKYKMFKETDATITGVYEGQSKYAGKLGGFTVEAVVDDNFVTCSVGSGLLDADRDYLWRIRNTLIGKTIEVKYQGLTDTKDSLRFPIFVKFKDGDD